MVREVRHRSAKVSKKHRDGSAGTEETVGARDHFIASSIAKCTPHDVITCKT